MLNTPLLPQMSQQRADLYQRELASTTEVNREVERLKTRLAASEDEVNIFRQKVCPTGYSSQVMSFKLVTYSKC